MTTPKKRVSNEQILAALNELPNAIATAIAGAGQSAAATLSPSPNSTPTKDQQQDAVQIDAGYKEHMQSKIQAFANEHGEDCIMYARRNGRGETKIAYCLASKWTTLKDRGLIGALEHIEVDATK